MLKIAITGGAGSGKSTVARMFQELGAEVLDADQVARDVVAVGRPAWEELRQEFGPDFFLPDGALNRPQLARRVFGDGAARRRLNAIVHPRVAQEIKARLGEWNRQGVKLVLVEVPLLFEAGLDKAYDRIIAVYAKKEDQIQRLQGRDRREQDEIAGILEAQWPLEEKVSRADYVVDNSGTLPATRDQVKNIWKKLQNHLDRGR